MWSIAEVSANPTDLWAWAGLSGDLVDVLLPFVGGIGETVKAASTLNDAGDIAQKMNRIDEILSSAVDTTWYEGVLKNYVKDGSIYNAFLDFIYLDPSDTKLISTSYGAGLHGTIGSISVVLRNGSKTGGATLEITKAHKHKIKIRYLSEG